MTPHETNDDSGDESDAQHRQTQHVDDNSSSQTGHQPASPQLHDKKEADHAAHIDDNELVRQQSLRLVRSAQSTSGENPFLSSDPALDPTSPSFSSQAWLKALLQATSKDPERYPKRASGVSFQNLTVKGGRASIVSQDDFFSWPVSMVEGLLAYAIGKKAETTINVAFDGLVKSGEMLLVLGRPGSGVSTFLKTIAGEMRGLQLEPGSRVNYQGIPFQKMHTLFRGEALYLPESDTHFALLPVSYTLEFAAALRCPKNRLPGVTRNVYAQHLRDVVMAMYGIRNTRDTRVGNDFIRGVSGGERKRVSIAEATLSQSVVQCWDNSTKGLDSATAIDFTKVLKLSTEITGTTTIAALYQAAESSYEMFDKVTLLYEGRQIYFGPRSQAKAYFTDMGYHCPDRQTTADFLTSLTNPAERTVRPSFEQKVPRTPEEFATAWKNSLQFKELEAAVTAFDELNPLGEEKEGEFLTVRKSRKSEFLRGTSPYTVSVPRQIWLCVARGYFRLMQDLLFFGFTVGQNLSTGLIVGSVFYNLPDSAESISHRLSLLFFAVLFNALAASFEIIPLYASRPVIQKHKRYAMYHPFADAIANMIMELPNKIAANLCLNVPLYFLAKLRPTAGAFLTFLLFGFASTLVISMVLRTLGHVTKTVYQALAPFALIIIGFIIYTGFVLPVKLMRGWLRWLEYVNPIAYAYQGIVINEMRGRKFQCSTFVPPYEEAEGEFRTCATPGAMAGQAFVDGDLYLREFLDYKKDHIWRNFGIVTVFIFVFMIIYLLAVEFINVDGDDSSTFVFLNKKRSVVKSAVVDEEIGHPTTASAASPVDAKADPSENAADRSGLARSNAKAFQWKNISYDITMHGKDCRILNDIFGWIKPGSLTALMGATGAGKTTLLDVLADRISVGVVTGKITVNGIARTKAFASHTGYAKQQDIHLPTATVREALRFSAVLRQRERTNDDEKFAYVEEIIVTLDMKHYADAIIGEPGHGLNAEQRKRLTIGIELAAKPSLLLFLDEPTSGLDSQTAWSIGNLLRKLADQGQAILCTIHQPSALLFQQFDRMLLLKKGGRMIYFGDLGTDSRTMIDYFEKNGAKKCEAFENPAEWMLNVTGAGIGGDTQVDWADVWQDSEERRDRVKELDAAIRASVLAIGTGIEGLKEDAFATSFWVQFRWTLGRAFQQYWRTPSYLWSKLILVLSVSLLVGLSFQSLPLTMQGLNSITFSIFMLLNLLVFMAYQTMPHFILHRDIFEARERASKTYSWLVFVLVNIIVELPWTVICAVIMHITWYYPVGLHEYGNAGRGGLVFLLLWSFMLFTATLTDLVSVVVETAELGALGILTLFTSCVVFCGIIMPRADLPTFWRFMYRVSPMTYLVSGLMSTGLSGEDVVCSPLEVLKMRAPLNSTCEEYLRPFTEAVGGLVMSGSGQECVYCSVRTTDDFMGSIEINYSDRWRNLGLQFVYIVFNVVVAVGVYWIARVPKKGGWWRVWQRR